MAFGRYREDVTGAVVLSRLSQVLGDLGSAMDGAEALAGAWDVLAAGKTDVDIATKLFGDATQPNLDRVADILDAVTAIKTIRLAADGDDTVTIPTVVGQGKTWNSMIVKFS